MDEIDRYYEGKREGALAEWADAATPCGSCGELRVTFPDAPECPHCGAHPREHLPDPEPCEDCGGAGIRSEAEAQAVADREGCSVELTRGYCVTCEASGVIPPFGEF